MIGPLPSSAPILCWTDGACEPNPGQGGWGAHFRYPDGRVVEQCDGARQTTNNRMEMTAILEALAALPAGAHVVVYSDSQYCVNGLTVWSKAWSKRGWHTKQKQPMPNRDLWLLLDSQMKRVNARLEWVRGHNGNAGNERADELAEMGRQKVLRGG